MGGQMFGAPVGISIAEADMRANELHKLSMETGEVKLEEAKLTLGTQKKMMELMQGMGGQQPGPDGQPPAADLQSMAGGGGGPTDSLARSMDSLATLALQSGLPEQAKQYAEAGSTLRSQAAEIANKQTTGMVTKLQLYSSLLAGVSDETSWRQANAMYEVQTGTPSPYAKAPYSPEVVDKLKLGLTTAKDRALIKAAEARAQSSRAEIAERQARVPLIKAQTKFNEERTKALEKTGAVNKAPKAGELKAVTDLAVKDFGGAVPAEDLRVLARPVAERMLEIIKSDNVSQSEAAVRAYQEAKSAGHFGGIKPRNNSMGSVGRPLEIPTAKDKLKPNMYYAGKGQYQGQVLLWNGKGFTVVDPNSGTQDDPDEDDEDEEDE